MRKVFQTLFVVALFIFIILISVSAKTKKNNNFMTATTFKGLKLRGIGPAFMSGRIADIAIDPYDKSTWYIAVGSGGVWKTTNSGTTFESIFDNQSSYSIGCVTIDPNDSNIVWVGTGENVSGRHVGFGDGVYRSLDGGKTWENMGVKESEHIDKIIVNPENSDIIYVAAEGPLWNAGGERGVYKSINGGKHWKKSLYISKDTGITDLIMDPRDPNVLYAAAHQRRRHVAALINGGPESAIYKTNDGGENWKKLTNGLPEEDMGQIGLAISPQNPDVIYATIETAIRNVNFYRSPDKGAHWEKMSEYNMRGTGPHYYQELFACPHKFDRIYAVDINILVSEDGGKTWDTIPEKYKHGDNHALSFDPEDPDFLLCGSDGGLYETHDRGKTWRFITNLPVTQFYKIAIDNDKPFYNIVGGTQDNNTQLGPSRTLTVHGIRNSDWIVTYGGDGYSCQIDPTDPNIVYCEAQVGSLARYDKKSGETTGIKPQPEPGDDAPRWNWDSPIIISPHSNTRLYFGSQRLYRSDDRGNSWEPISGDLSRGLKRLKMEFMGRTWSPDAVWDNDAMSYYGNITAISESPLVEGLIYCGTDDGLIQITEDGGKNWRRIEQFPGIPNMSFVNDIQASVNDADIVFAVFDNHKRGDLNPYILKSTNRGRTWTSINGDFPERHIVWSIVQDDVKPELLFAGTEFGIFFTLNGGKNWIKFEGGVPTIAFRDLEIQRRENDLVGGSFGRGIYILDDYTPLRSVSENILQKEAILFSVKKTPMYFPIQKLGRSKKASQGDTFFTAPNPPHGAVFTYYLKETLKTMKKKRRKKEKQLAKQGKDVPFPGWDKLKKEYREEKPEIFIVVKNSQGNIVRKIKGPITKGFHRVNWDLHYPSMEPPRITEPEKLAWEYSSDRTSPGYPAAPGEYTATLFKRVNGKVIQLSSPQKFECYSPNLATLPAKDKIELLNFQKQTAEMQRKIYGASKILSSAFKKIKYLKKALYNTPEDTEKLYKKARDIEIKLYNLSNILYGNNTKRNRFEPTKPGIFGRLYTIISGNWRSSSAPTQTHRRQLELVKNEFKKLKQSLSYVNNTELKKLLEEAYESGVPWTPGQDIISK